MYSVVLMAALSTGAAEPGWFCGGCSGSAYIHCGGGCSSCWGCWGGGPGSAYGYYGCYGCWGYNAHYACYGTCGGSWGCMGYYTCNGCWGGGCAGGTDYAPTYISKPVYTGPPPPPPKPAAKEAPEVAPPPKPKPEPEKKPSQARLIIDLPDEAKLYIDDQMMKTTSAHRTFRTPSLEAGQIYYYIVRAELTQDGKRFTQSQRVLVRAGESAQASFTDLASAKNEEPKSVARAAR